jgi:hypothetical protein
MEPAAEAELERHYQHWLLKEGRAVVEALASRVCFTRQICYQPK